MIRWLRSFWAKSEIPARPQVNYRLDVGDDVTWRVQIPVRVDNGIGMREEWAVGRIIGLDGDQAHVFCMEGPFKGPHTTSRSVLKPVYQS